jgi:streptogramin lyase
VPIEQSPSGQVQVVDGYVWISGERGLLRIDPGTNTVDRVIPRSVLGTGPTDRVWVTSDAIWSCTAGTGVVRRSQLRTGRVVAEIQLPTSCFEVSGDTDDVWIGGTSFEGGRSWVHHVDARTNEHTASLEVDDGGHLPVAGAGAVWLDTVAGGLRIAKDASEVLAVAARPAGDVSFVSAFGSGAFWTTRESEQVVVRIDAESLRVEEFAAGPGVNAVAVADGTLWASNSDAGTVMRFDVDPWRTEGDR